MIPDIGVLSPITRWIHLILSRDANDLLALLQAISKGCAGEKLEV